MIWRLLYRLAKANILQVDHKRDVPDLAMNQSIVEVTVECRGEPHSKEILSKVEEQFSLLK